MSECFILCLQNWTFSDYIINPFVYDFMAVFVFILWSFVSGSGTENSFQFLSSHPARGYNAECNVQFSAVEIQFLVVASADFNKWVA
jgi:hypothetical protein